MNFIPENTVIKQFYSNGYMGRSARRLTEFFVTKKGANYKNKNDKTDIEGELIQITKDDVGGYL